MGSSHRQGRGTTATATARRAAGRAGSPALPGARGPAACDVDGFRSALLRFYDERRRDLPWRRDTDPYRVWVSEVMLQQTRVETVIPYYERWMERFPDLDALACAEPDDVLRAWEGLGYYSRARNLQRATQVVRERHAGAVPQDAGALRALPGIGDYTAGAIASIAFGRPEPAIDGNVRRVLARITDDAAPAHASLRALAAGLVDPVRPGDFNQALMELGATVCTPRGPDCAACPVTPHCRAFASGTQELRPARRTARAVPRFHIGTLLLTGPDGRVLLERRPETGLLAGLWTFPGRVAASAAAAPRAVRRAARELLGGRRLGRLRLVTTVEHVFSHRREVYHVHHARLRHPVEPSAAARWVDATELPHLALSAAQRRIAGLADAPNFVRQST